MIYKKKSTIKKKTQSTTFCITTPSQSTHKNLPTENQSNS